MRHISFAASRDLLDHKMARSLLHKQHIGGRQMQKGRGYRIVYRKERDCPYAMHEVWYSGDGKLLCISDNPVDFRQLDITEYLEQLELVTEATRLPILDYTRVSRKESDARRTLTMRAVAIPA
jgi:hypothetical protein